MFLITTSCHDKPRSPTVFKAHELKKRSLEQIWTLVAQGFAVALGEALADLQVPKLSEANTASGSL